MWRSQSKEQKMYEKGLTRNRMNKDKKKQDGRGMTTEALQMGLKSISTQISNLRTELKADYTSFKVEFNERGAGNMERSCKQHNPTNTERTRQTERFSVQIQKK